METLRLKKYLSPHLKNFIREFKNNNGFRMIAGEIELSMIKRSIRGGNGSKDRSKCILFYPHFPSYGYIMYNICRILGIRMTNNINDTFHLAIDWQDRTYKQGDSVFAKIGHNFTILNAKCCNIDKKNIDSVFKQVFGYSIMIDPLRFQGCCIEKSNLNGRHDGTIIRCPTTTIDEECVYQKIINNQIDDELVEDIRVPVFRDLIPFVYLKYRGINDRFSNTNTKAIVCKVEDILSREETNKIKTFCRNIGLDYGELDVLRNRDDGLVYVVDVNNTPFGPPNHLPKKDKVKALRLLAETFQSVFINN